MSSSSDTIAAIATPPGFGGIAILRISGPDAPALLGRLFSFAPDNTSRVFRPRVMHFGHALDKNAEALDEALAVYMPGPHSATGEDVGEIHCHGGPGITAALLEAALAAGARLAEPGEFTRRAFLSGRLDLTQAEAVAELIAAPTREGVRLAAAKLDGALGREVRALRSALDGLRMQITLAVDFPEEEEGGGLSRPQFTQAVREALHSLERLLGAFGRARLWREGATAVLAGRVNAGKSSLLNALLGRERAIVSALPGTTRDYIEETLNLEGMPVRLIDTAGLRPGGDVVEEEGIRRSRSLAEEADVLLFVADVREPLQPEEADFLRRHAGLAASGRLLLVLNKADTLTPVPWTGEGSAGGTDVAPAGVLAWHDAACAAVAGAKDRENVTEASGRVAATDPGLRCFAVSAREGQGLDALTKGLRQALERLGGGTTAGELAPNLRQSELLRAARAELLQLGTAVEAGLPADILGLHLEAAADILAAVTGSASTEDVLNSIFASFCIGK